MIACSLLIAGTIGGALLIVASEIKLLRKQLYLTKSNDQLPADVQAFADSIR